MVFIPSTLGLEFINVLSLAPSPGRSRLVIRGAAALLCAPSLPVSPSGVVLGAAYSPGLKMMTVPQSIMSRESV